MKKNINITIEKPCSRNFNNFKKTALGGFCASCSKEVIDFTKKNDKEILAYFKINTKNTCGYFNTNQLKTYSEFNNHKEQKKYNLFVALSFSLFSLFSNSTITAQEKKIDSIVATPLKKVKEHKNTIHNSIIKGVIYSEADGYPLPGASVVLRNSIIGTDTDFDGNFQLKNIKAGDIISVYYLGFQSQEITIQKNQTFLKIVMQTDTSVFDTLVVAGEVHVKTTYKAKRSFWQRIKSIF